MTSNRKQTSKGDVHTNILKRAEKLSRSGSKVFDENSLEANEEDLLKESKRLGLSRDDIQEIQMASKAANAKETNFERTNLSEQIKYIESSLEDYVEVQKQSIRFIESHMKRLIELIYRDRIELELINRESVRDMIKSYHEILHNITTNMATESTLASQMRSVNAKLQVSKE